jgi:hypothetical protein
MVKKKAGSEEGYGHIVVSGYDTGLSLRGF